MAGGLYPNGPLPKDLADLGGEWEELGPKPGHIPIDLTDSYTFSPQGGGGWGDPLDRDPQEVLNDLRREKISVPAAEQIYGVCPSVTPIKPARRLFLATIYLLMNLKIRWT